MKAIILAGGLGTRLRPFTQILPKPMLPVGDRSILEIQIEHLKKFGVDEVIFAANYKSDLLQNYFGNGQRVGMKLTYSIEDKRLGTAGPLSLIKDNLSEPFIVMNGDILTNIDFNKAYDYHCSKSSILTVISKEVTFPLSYGNLKIKGDLIVEIQEKPDIKVDICSGLYVMSPGIFDHIPYNEAYGMDQLMQALIAKNIPVYRYQMEEYWLDIGRMEDYEQAQKDYSQVFEN